MENSKAVVLAFPGRLTAINEDWAREMTQGSGFDSYEQYMMNLHSLIGVMREIPGVPFYIVKDRYFGDCPPSKRLTHDYISELNVPTNTELLFWDAGRHCISDWRFIGRVGHEGRVILPNSRIGKHCPVHNEGDFDWDNLKIIGIDTVLLGGELSGANGRPMAVAEIGREMIGRGFNVRGIEGCVYPITQPEMKYDHPLDLKNVKPVMEALYSQAVNPREVLH